jgi:hypothetical protein
MVIIYLFFLRKLKKGIILTTVPVSNENNKYARQFKSRKNVDQLERAPDENLIASESAITTFLRLR